MVSEEGTWVPLRLHRDLLKAEQAFRARFFPEKYVYKVFRAGSINLHIFHGHPITPMFELGFSPNELFSESVHHTTLVIFS